MYFAIEIETKYCFYCLKNMHEKVEMIKQEICGKKVLVCPKCGSMKVI